MAPSGYSTVATTLESIARNKPAYAELIATFSPLLAAKDALAKEFAAEDHKAFQVDYPRLAQGMHALAGMSCTPLTPHLRTAATTILPLLGEIIPDTLWPGKNTAINQLDGNTLTKLAEAKLSGDEKAFEKISENMDGTSSAILFSCIENILAPVLSGLAQAIGKSFAKHHWDKGNCPICGSLPSIGYLSRREENDFEHLVGGGGKKHLHCSLCGYNWPHRRDACAACGNTDPKTREIIHAGESRHERIEACNKCGTYCLCVDLRECDPIPQLDAVQLGLIHLDMIAQKKKLSPMVLTTWNSLSS